MPALMLQLQDHLPLLSSVCLIVVSQRARVVWLSADKFSKLKASLFREGKLRKRNRLNEILSVKDTSLNLVLKL